MISTQREAIISKLRYKNGNRGHIQRVVIGLLNNRKFPILGYTVRELASETDCDPEMILRCLRDLRKRGFVISLPLRQVVKDKNVHYQRLVYWLNSKSVD